MNYKSLNDALNESANYASYEPTMRLIFDGGKGDEKYHMEIIATLKGLTIVVNGGRVDLSTDASSKLLGTMKMLWKE